MSGDQQNVDIARYSVPALVGALVLAGLCLALGSLPGPQAVVLRYLFVALGALIPGLTLLRVGIQHDYLWWMLPCAAALLGIALSLGLKVIIPSTSILFLIGVVLASVGLGLSITAGNVHTPVLIFAISGLVLFIALMFLLGGLGYAFRWISLLCVAVGFGFAISALYLPKIVVYALACVLAVLSLLSAPSPESGLRLLLPTLLIIGGLTLLRYSRKES